MYKLIPEELKKLNHWICWKAIPDPKAHSGIKKVPINPNKPRSFASANDPSTWSDFETAERVSRDYAGIAFVFTGSGYFGIDIDDRPEELQDYLNGECDESNTFYQFIETMQSYAELSQSGNGIHIICKGKLPSKDFRNDKKKVEMYAGVRYFCMTGNHCSSYIDITDGSETVKPLYEEYRTGNNQPEHAETPPLMPVSCSLSAQEIIQKIRESRQGKKFAMLYDSGDISAYNDDDSSADMALCNILAFWCGGDTEKMDEIFRSSALMRPKWDKKNAGSTYGGRTMQKAIDSCHEFYQPNQPAVIDMGLKIGKKAEQPASKESAPKQSTKVIPNGKMYKFDDSGNAERLFDMYGDIFRYCYIEHKYLYYHNGKWYFDNIGYERRIADYVVSAMEQDVNLYADDEDIQKAFLRHCSKSRSFTGKTNMLREAQHYAPIMPEQLDRDKTVIGTKNGMISLKTGELIPHDKNAFLTKQVPIEYNPDSENPELWFQFLDEIFQSDKELIRYIQKALGYSLTGSTQEQCAFFLYGTGRNGKSTFLEIVRNILGDYASNIQPETIMVNPKSGNSASSDLARLKGARFVTSVEPNEGMKLNEGLIKQMTGGDVMTVRKLYCEEFEFRPEFKLWMATNHKPVIRGTDTGIWRRVHMIPFNACIPIEKVDTHLIYKLAKESKQIFKWMIDGCLLWQKEGLKMPKAVYDAVREYQQEMDVISNFLENCCIIGQGEVKASVLYAVYAQWCSEYGEYKMSSTKFGMEMQKKFQKRKSSGLYYVGLELDEEHQMLTIG